MKKLKDIIPFVSILQSVGKQDASIEHIQFDSRQVSANTLFVAVKGTQTDGHQYIHKAIEQGAVAVLCQTLPENLSEAVCYLQVADSSEALAYVAASFYDHPSQKLKLVGITGTNGKTTTASLLYDLFSDLGYRTGLLSTVRNYIADQTKEATHTTPDALKINELLHEMVQAGCTHAFMEVSSHAIDQNRIAGLEFAGGVFTNLTHDHLDYHKSFSEYLKAKKKFFDQLPKTAFALSNMDDKNGLVMLQNTKATAVSYAIRAMADYKAKVLEKHVDGNLLTINQTELWVQLVGNFNAYNLLAVAATAQLLGLDSEMVLPAVSKLRPVSGRFETMHINGVTGIVDYAHTPDALENVLKTILEIKQKNQNLITVVGTGGDRDNSKRPIMAEIASRYSNRLILTSDNPRSEKPESIIEQMYAGIQTQDMGKLLKITDRREAIKTACMLATEQDIILIAGKGHENYQEINGVKYHFDDKEVFQEQMKIINN